MDIDARGHYTQGIPRAGENRDINRDILDALRDCLSNGASLTWEAFIALAQPVIAAAVFRAIRRWGGNRSAVDDLIQDTFAKLCAANCRVLRNFRGRDSAS